MYSRYSRLFELRLSCFLSVFIDFHRFIPIFRFIPKKKSIFQYWFTDFFNRIIFSNVLRVAIILALFHLYLRIRTWIKKFKHTHTHLFHFTTKYYFATCYIIKKIVIPSFACFYFHFIDFLFFFLSLIDLWCLPQIIYKLFLNKTTSYIQKKNF